MDKYKLANNPLLLIYYKRQTGRELNEDLLKIVDKNKMVIHKLKNRDPQQSDEDFFLSLSDEEIESIDESVMIELVLNLFYAMRCAFEMRQLNFAEVIGTELKMSDVYDKEFVQDLINFAYKDVKNN